MAPIIPEAVHEPREIAQLRRVLLVMSFIAGPLGLFLISEHLTGGYYVRLIASFADLSFADPFAGLIALGRKIFTAFIWLPALYIAFGGSCVYAALTALILRPAAWWRRVRTGPAEQN